MGYYINPPDMTKEEFLAKHGQPLPNPAAFDFQQAAALPICLVDNGWMTAAVICYNARERDVFLHDTSGRPKKWFTVSRELLLPYYNPNPSK